jgi:hypothetical protein
MPWYPMGTPIARVIFPNAKVNSFDAVPSKPQLMRAASLLQTS